MKAISKDAQAVLELLIDGLGGTSEDERASRTIDNAPGAFMAVTVERVGARRYSVAHYFTQGSDRMRDPEIVFIKGEDGRFYPIEFTQDSTSTYQRLVDFDDADIPTRIMVRPQRGCATFCATWMQNIKQQQKLKRHRLPPPPAPPEPPPAPPSSALDAREIATDLIDPNPDQPRKHFDEQRLQELAGSIKETTLQQPIKVRPKADGRFEIVMGERRWRAHKLLGMPTIKAFVEDMTDDQMADAAIIENLQRADISPLEEARAFQRRLDSGLTVEQLALRLGLRQPHRITERTCLLQLFPEYQEAFGRGDLKPSEAYELAQLKGDYQRALFNAIRDGKCRSYNDLRAVAQAFRDAEASQVPVLVVQNKGTQLTVFDDTGPSESQRAGLTALERKIVAVEALLRDGLKDNEVVITAKIARENAPVMAERLRLIGRQLDKLRRALLAQSAVVEVAKTEGAAQ